MYMYILYFRKTRHTYFVCIEIMQRTYFEGKAAVCFGWIYCLKKILELILLLFFTTNLTRDLLLQTRALITETHRGLFECNLIIYWKIVAEIELFLLLLRPLVVLKPDAINPMHNYIYKKIFCRVYSIALYTLKLGRFQRNAANVSKRLSLSAIRYFHICLSTLKLTLKSWYTDYGVKIFFQIIKQFLNLTCILYKMPDEYLYIKQFNVLFFQYVFIFFLIINIIKKMIY